MLVVLFSLSPCTVKESVYHVFGTEYQRPINKTKTTQSFQSTCQAQVFSTSTAHKISKISDFDLFRIAIQSFQQLIPIDQSGNPQKRNELSVEYSPHLFILYKRLKLGLA